MHSWYSAVKATKAIPQAMACILWMEKWEVNWTDCLFMPQDLVEIQVEQPQKEDDYQEYTKLENLDGFRFEADIYV